MGNCLATPKEKSIYSIKHKIRTDSRQHQYRQKEKANNIIKHKRERKQIHINNESNPKEKTDNSTNSTKSTETGVENRKEESTNFKFTKGYIDNNNQVKHPKGVKGRSCPSTQKLHQLPKFDTQRKMDMNIMGDSGNKVNFRHFSKFLGGVLSSPQPTYPQNAHINASQHIKVYIYIYI